MGIGNHDHVPFSPWCILIKDFILVNSFSVHRRRVLHLTITFNTPLSPFSLSFLLDLENGATEHGVWGEFLYLWLFSFSILLFRNGGGK